MSTDRLMDKEVMIHIYTMEYYSAMKRNKFESVVVRQMNLELVIQGVICPLPVPMNEHRRSDKTMQCGSN